VPGTALPGAVAAEPFRALRWFSTQSDVSHAIASARTVADAIPRVLRAVCDALAWDVGEFWTLDATAGVLRCRGTWHSPLLELLNYEAATAALSFAPGSGLAGNAWLGAEPIWATELATEPRFAYRQEIARIGLKAGVAFPVRHRGAVTGVLVFFSRAAQHPDAMLEQMLTSLGQQIGDFLARARAEDELRTSEERFRALVEHAHDAVLLLDRDGVARFASQSTAGVLGYSAEGIAEQRLFGLVHPEDRARMEASFAECLATPGHVVRGEYRMRHADGGWRAIESVGANRLAEAAVSAVVVTLRDITDRKQAEAALRASEQRYALAARGTNDGLWDWDLATNRVYYSPRWKGMLGYDEAAIGDSPDEWFTRVHAKDLTPLRAAIDAHLAGTLPHFEFEYRIRHREGIYLWTVARGLALRDPSGIPVRVAGSQTDVSDRKRAERRLRDQATRDPLTDLPNRLLFSELLAQAVAHARRDPAYRYAVLFLDLDRFKVINDSLGHLVGDQLLVAFAHRLEHCVRPQDAVARLGGDEFAVLLESVGDSSEPSSVASRIQHAVAKPFRIHGREVFTSASIGIADSSALHERPEDVLRDADLAMYRAKATGGSRHQVFDTTMHTQAMALHELDTALRRAVQHKEFVLYYQPIVALRDRRIAGFEALIRWHHATRGLVLPAQFIPVAEETGLIAYIGTWVLREACRQMAEWQRTSPLAGGLTISVNVTGTQLLQGDFPGLVQQVLEETGLAAGRLRLEITETALMSDADAASEVLTQLRAKGIGIMLDDFGTGYSSLGNLYRLPIDTLKIDRSFVAAVDLNRQNAEIIEAIAALARALSIDLIAEGVETEAQLTALQALRCRHGQGFYLSAPVSAESVAAWLMARAPHGDLRL
jgi:diguanylate cyclase (GGDEF)-like protein/PAS domain S-box-containing protein